MAMKEMLVGRPCSFYILIHMGIKSMGSKFLHIDIVDVCRDFREHFSQTGKDQIQIWALLVHIYW